MALKTFDQMYKALACYHLDYCDLIYHIPPTSLHNLIENVERIQYQAALAITGAWRGSNRLKIYEELRWDRLYDRRLSIRIPQIHKIIDGNPPPPPYLKDC